MRSAVHRKVLHALQGVARAAKCCSRCGANRALHAVALTAGAVVGLVAGGQSWKLCVCAVLCSWRRIPTFCEGKPKSHLTSGCFLIHARDCGARAACVHEAQSALYRPNPNVYCCHFVCRYGMSAVVANLLSRLNDEVSVTVFCVAIVAVAHAEQPQWQLQVCPSGPEGGGGTLFSVTAFTHPRV